VGLGFPRAATPSAANHLSSMRDRERRRNLSDLGFSVLPVASWSRWSGRWDSNPRSRAPKARALPARPHPDDFEREYRRILDIRAFEAGPPPLVSPMLLVDETSQGAAGAMQSTLPATIRETVDAVATLTAFGGDTTGIAVAHSLGLDKSAASRRVRVAVERGHLRNLEDRRGHPSRLVLGDPLPADSSILAEPGVLERLHGCTAIAGDIPRRNDGTNR
jgi:hypothetical protein